MILFHVAAILSNDLSVTSPHAAIQSMLGLGKTDIAGIEAAAFAVAPIHWFALRIASK